MTTLERRIEALEQIHSEKNYVNVFRQYFNNVPPITQAAFGDLVFEKRPDETIDQFQTRVVQETQHIPREGDVRSFAIRLSEKDFKQARLANSSN